MSVSISKSKRSEHGATESLWYARCGGATASTIAIHLDWIRQEFEPDGITVSALHASPERDVRDAHFNHHIPALFREGGNIPAIWAKAGGADTAVVGITWVDEYQGILARRDSGIRDIGDLKGKRLALPKHPIPIDFVRGMAVHGFVTALGLANLSINDAIRVDLPAPDIDHREGARVTARPIHTVAISALLEGAVDAIYLKGAFGAALAREHDLVEVYDINRHPDPLVRVNNGTPRPITVGREFLEARPDLVVRYLEVLLRAANWAQSNPEEAASAIAGEAGGANSAEAIAGFGDSLHRKLRPALSELFISGLESQKNFLRDWDFLPADFDARAWVVPAPLREAEARIVNASGASVQQTH